ncbi:hypothetical protein DB41_IB00100 [Neochlamydia sp. TUME1]|uniref:ligase-associated DNA damage response exonuclease n=1 Tax=Neochlamydia sp. TUME1 TaxID=1478174 RepID=UPI0005800E16|nr:ligase-associated DNA damage response exonuclease [Neochlamydia sp. TUME1]KIC74877.1 hypothetical protein DB41_IB00100 [Neochlamydia sp. TUME1]
MKIPLEVRREGLYCCPGQFYIDAWKPVPLSIITHAHGDHAYRGHQHYITSKDSKDLLLHRLGSHISLQVLSYGEKIKIKDCWVSLHPAGHILGSSQIRIETNNTVTVISGDYKRALDPTCQPFETLECDIFVTESTFGLPIYRWQDSLEIAKEMFEWWEQNKANNHPSIIYSYSLGKAQRILSLLKSFTDQSAYLHGAMMSLTKIYAEKGIEMLPFIACSEQPKGYTFSKDLILAPPSAAGSPWLKRFPHFRAAAASGWMLVRGARKRKGMDQGFVLSDHADWEGLIQTIKQSQAKVVLTTHGSTDVLAKYLREQLHVDARELRGLDVLEEEID